MAHIRRPILVGLRQAARPNSEATRLADPANERDELSAARGVVNGVTWRYALEFDRLAGLVRGLIGASGLRGNKQDSVALSLAAEMTLEPRFQPWSGQPAGTE